MLSADPLGVVANFVQLLLEQGPFHNPTEGAGIHSGSFSRQGMSVLPS